MQLLNEIKVDFIATITGVTIVITFQLKIPGLLGRVYNKYIKKDNSKTIECKLCEVWKEKKCHELKHIDYKDKKQPKQLYKHVVNIDEMDIDCKKIQK